MSSNDEKPMKKKKAESDWVEVKKSGLIAKKDFHISHNEYNRKITAGEDISDVPEPTTRI